MTTYSSAITLTETELWAVEAAMKFYVTPDAKKLREASQPRQYLKVDQDQGFVPQSKQGAQ
jgi:hypothetical protein